MVKRDLSLATLRRCNVAEIFTLKWRSAEAAPDRRSLLDRVTRATCEREFLPEFRTRFLSSLFWT
jgi:hypothetical protein